MHDFWVFPAKQSGEFAMGSAGPDRPRGDESPPNCGKLRNLMIAPAIRDHDVAGALEKALFLLEYDVFASRLLIFVMNRGIFMSVFQAKCCQGNAL